MVTRRNRKGFTLIELAISVLILSITLGGLGLAMLRGMELFRTSTATATSRTRAGRALHRVVSELRSASSDTLTDLTTPPGAAKFWADSIDYRHAVDWVDNALVLGPDQRIALELAPGELDNGIDDNGNGLVDERVVVLLDDVGAIDEQRLVLATRVAELLGGELPNGVDDNGNGIADEAGLCFDQEGSTVTIRLTLQGIGPSGELIERTFEDAIVLKN